MKVLRIFKRMDNSTIRCPIIKLCIADRKEIQTLGKGINLVPRILRILGPQGFWVRDWTGLNAKAKMTKICDKIVK